jgi:hypothetical protein
MKLDLGAEFFAGNVLPKTGGETEYDFLLMQVIVIT